MSNTAETLVAQAQSHRAASLAKVDPPLPKLPDPLPLNVRGLPDELLTLREVELTNLDATELIGLLASKKVSCEEVIRAFLRRAALAQELTNCVTELLWDEAVERARYLDSLPEPIGPLHGLPISIKEQNGMDGRVTNGSYVAWIGRPQPVSNRTAMTMYEAGAVFYVRTTEPQGVMHLETNNAIFGVTVNPYNRTLTCGGSSGGEGALLGLRGSVLGLGGDIGGSIRNPAGNNGVYGLKPTPGRLSGFGSVAAVLGQEGIFSVRGPLSTTREGLSLFMKTYLDSKPWISDGDHVLPLPWSDPELPQRLKIAVMWDDGFVRPHPPVLRALKEVVEACKQAGMEVIDWTPVGHDEAWDIATALYFEDGGKRMKELMAEGGEPVLPLTEWILSRPNVKYRTVEDIWALKLQRNAYRSMYNKLWHKTAEKDGQMADVILCPYLPSTAPPLETSKYWCYTSQWNVLEYPAAVFPVTAVDLEKDLPEKGYVPRNEDDKFFYELYDSPETFKHAPVSLQLVGRKFEDEKVLAVMEKIERAMGRA